MTDYNLRLSKFLCYILRHAPDKYSLTLDKNGYAALEKILAILKEKFRNFKKQDLLNLVSTDPKGRFEITNDKIRATYGHSVKISPKSKGIIPPDILYHGTSKKALDRILAEGLKSMRRQFVHLSINEKDAYAVGLRHAKEPVILKIMAKQASDNGIEFFKEGSLFLAESIPKDYIRVHK